MFAQKSKPATLLARRKWKQDLAKKLTALKQGNQKRKPDYHYLSPRCVLTSRKFLGIAPLEEQGGN